MSAMSMLNEFFLTTTAKTRVRDAEANAPRSTDLNSSTLFVQILADIVISQYKVEPSFLYAGEIWQESGRIIGTAIGLSPATPQVLYAKETAKIWSFLRDLQVEDFDNRLTFDIKNVAVFYDRKMDMYDVLKAFVENPATRIKTPDNMPYKFGYHQNISRPIQLAEYISANVQRIRKNMLKDDNFALDAIVGAECKPYLSEQHYVFAAGLAASAPTSVSMDHLLKTICQEDGIEIPKGRRKSELSGELITFELNGGYN